MDLDEKARSHFNLLRENCQSEHSPKSPSNRLSKEQMCHRRGAGDSPPQSTSRAWFWETEAGQGGSIRLLVAGL